MKIASIAALAAAASFLVSQAVARAAGAEPAVSSPDSMLTLETAVAAALADNAELRELEARVETARSAVDVASQYPFNPELNFDEGLERHVGINQTIEWPGKRALREALARQDVATAEAALQGFRVALAAELRARIYELLAARRIADLEADTVATAQAVASAANRRVREGFASVSESTLAEVEVARARQKLRAAQNEARRAATTVSLLLGREPDTPLAVSAELVAPTAAPPLPVLLTTTLERNAELGAKRSELAKRKIGVDQARKSAAPDFTIGPLYEQDTKSPSETKVGAGITIPIPVWSTSGPKVRAALAERREAEVALENARRQIMAAVENAAATFASAIDQLAMYTPELQNRLDGERAATKERYARGELPFLTLLEIQRTHFELKRDLYEKLAAARDAEAELEKLVGAPLEDLR